MTGTSMGRKNQRQREEMTFMERAMQPFRKRLRYGTQPESEGEGEEAAASAASTLTSSVGRPEGQAGVGREVNTAVEAFEGNTSEESPSGVGSPVTIRRDRKEQVFGLFKEFLLKEGVILPDNLPDNLAAAYSKPLPASAAPKGVGKKAGTWKQVWASKCEECLPYLNDICTPGIVEKALVQPAMQVGWERRREAARPTPSAPVAPGAASSNGSPTGARSTDLKLEDALEPASAWFAGLKWAKAPGLAKKAWEEAGGKAQSHFRNCVMRGVVRDIQCNAEFILRKLMAEDREQAMTGEEEEVAVPDWMKTGFIRGPTRRRTPRDTPFR